MKTLLPFLLLILPFRSWTQHTTAQPSIDDIIQRSWENHEDEATREEALDLAETALAESEKAGYAKGEANARSIIGRIALLNHHWDIANVQYGLCLQVRRQAGDTCGVASACNNLAELNIYTGDYTSAIWYGQHAERILLEKIEKNDTGKTEAKKLIPKVYEKLSAIYSDKKDHTRAIQYGRLAKEHAEDLKDTVFLARAYYNLASRYFNGQTTAPQPAIYRDSAFWYYRTAYTLFQYMEEYYQLAEIDNSIASIFIDQLQSDSAWIYLNRSKEQYLNIGDSSDAFYVWKNIGRLHLLQKNYPEALKYLKTAERTGKDEPDAYLNLYEYMYRVFKEMGNDKDAYFYIDKVGQMKDTLYRNSQDLFNETVRRNLELREKITRQNLNAERDKNRIAVLVAALLGLFAFAVWLAYRNTVRKNREKSLEIDVLIRSGDIRYVKSVEEKMDKIAADLHAEIGNSGYSLNMATSSLQANLAQLPELQNQATELKHLIKNVFEELRNISHNLGSTVLEKTGLVTAIKEMLQSLRAHSGINIEFHHQGNQATIGFEISRNLYRIIQNLLNNSLTHANPKNIKIDLIEYNNQLTLLYSDDGKGFDYETETAGAGLKDIERLANVLQTKPEKVPPVFGKGMSMRVIVPNLSTNFQAHGS